MADWGIPRNYKNAPIIYKAWDKFVFSILRKYQALILFALHEDHVSKETFGLNVDFGLLCHFCPDFGSKVVFISKREFTLDFIWFVHENLNKQNGHGAVGVIDKTYNLGDAEQVKTCEKSQELETPTWDNLTDSFHNYVWVGLVLTSLALGCIGRKVRFSLDFLFLMLGQSLRGHWTKLTPWLSLCLAMGTIFNISYQCKVTTDLVAPLPRARIISIKDLFTKRMYQFVAPMIPEENDVNAARRFKDKGIIYSPNLYYKADPALTGTSPASAWTRGELAGKYAGKGALLLDRTKVEFALAVTRVLYPNLSCNYVEENWGPYWESWLIKSHLADAAYVTKYQLFQAGFYRFWWGLMRYERYFFMKAKATRGNVTVSSKMVKPVKLDSTVLEYLRPLIQILYLPKSYS
ncbi:unnamed protein product [Allacma fusca]|uniref:Uncharacterized protein n=1 Tax=Allacma fusca TaxID=39272 RepID=A0A8J2LSY5_9HEXA|nr:unnamed protein product [Allacma fusca]